MGLLINGKWIDKWYDTASTKGKFIRDASTFREWIKADGSTPFQPEKDRYHLYISAACPWSHRTSILRRLKGLEKIVSISITDPRMLENGWEFSDSPGSIPDYVNNKSYLYEVYLAADPEYSGRVTVPLVWDKKSKTIVNNESADIMRMFNKEFNALTDNTLDFYPEELQDLIEQINEFVYHNINNGVYKAGFATTQAAYEEGVYRLFEALDGIEDILSDQPFLTGGKLTEADWRLFPTLIRFDVVYFSHFKCNKKRVLDYPNIYRYLKQLYHHDGIKETVDFDHIKRHYYASHKTINPTGIIPIGPELNL